MNNSLIEACDVGDVQRFQSILSRRRSGLLNINLIDALTGYTLLHRAISNNQIQIVALLLSEDECDIYIPTMDGFNAFHLCCYFGHLHIAELLLAKNYNIHLCDYNGRSCLHNSCLHDRSEGIGIITNNLFILPCTHSLTHLSS